MEYAAIAAAAVSLISSLIGVGKDAEAAALRKQMLDQYGPELLPHLKEAEARTMGPAAMQSMPEDDSLRRRQMDALSQLENEYQSGGMGESDKAALQLANDQVSGRANADGAAAAQSMAQRGMKNSGLGYALQIQGQQNAANSLGNMSRQNQVDARTRALQALEGGASLAGNVRGQDLSHASELSGAMDRIGMFNTGQLTATDVYNRGLPQQNFDNQMFLNNARTNASNGVAAGYEREGQNARDTGAGVSNSLLTYGMWGEEKGKKKS